MIRLMSKMIRLMLKIIRSTLEIDQMIKSTLGDKIMIFLPESVTERKTRKN